MTKIRNTFAGVLAMLVVLLGMGGTAQAADKRPSVRSVCETGYRGMPAYDAQCLTRGTFKDGAALWLRDGDGNRVSKADRRSMCRDSRAVGGIRPAVRDWFFDVAYDSYRNHRTVLRYAGAVAYLDCRALGVRNI
jgi:hypothetical protein